jgi:hypothetical protein
MAQHSTLQICAEPGPFSRYLHNKVEGGREIYFFGGFVCSTGLDGMICSADSISSNDIFGRGAFQGFSCFGRPWVSRLGSLIGLEQRPLLFALPNLLFALGKLFLAGYSKQKINARESGDP